jgi:hypothetical protein
VTGQQTSGPVCRLVAACAALFALGVLPLVSSASAVASASTAQDLVGVSITRISPPVAVPQTSVAVSGTVRNTGSAAIDSPIVRALIGERPLADRDAVSQWASSTEDQFAPEVAETPLAATLAPGAVAPYTITIAATAIAHNAPFAVLPVQVNVVGTTSAGTTSLGTVHTFLPALSSVKEYEPLSIAWLVPLTLDPDPALFGTDSSARTAAWSKAVGPGSRLDRLVTGTDRAKVTWAIDPAVLGPPDPSSAGQGSGSTPPTPTPRASASGPTPQGAAPTPDPVKGATGVLASRLRAAASRHTIWSLPYADPDLGALLPLAPDDPALKAMITRTSALSASVGPARTDVAWPVDGTLTSARQEQLRRAFASPGLGGAVTSAATLTSQNGFTGNASGKSSDGLALLAYDEDLSRTFAQTSSPAAGAITTQRFLADTLALLGERPGVRGRSVLVAAPRSFAGDPSVLSSFFAAVAKAPWLVPTSADQLLAASTKAGPEHQGVGTIGRPASPAPTIGPADPLSPGASPLTQARLQSITIAMSAITGIARIRDDAGLFVARWADAQKQVLSARWRRHPGGLAALERATTTAITTASQGVSVAPSSVNFFADKGVLQITVVNNLDVPVHDVRLTLTPGQPRLRIDEQPGPLRIGAKSRTNVPVRVTAVAAGLVPIDAVLSTPNGTPLGQTARVDVRVQPTSTWVYWALGAAAGVILLLGTYRSLRRGSTRASRPAAQEIPLDV